MSIERLKEIIATHEALEYHHQIPMLEEAVRLADQLENPYLWWDMRMALLSACVFGGAPEKSIMTFAWLESKSENDPEHFPASFFNGEFLEGTDLLWAYKWVLAELPAFPQVSRDHIEATAERFGTQLSRHQHSLRPYWKARTQNHIAFGDGFDAVREALENFRTAPRDVYADCYACELDFLVEANLFLGDVDRALKVAEPLFSGKESCAEVPHITYAALTIPTWHAGMKDRARLFHQKGYELCKTNPDFLTQICNLMGFRLLEGDWQGAGQLFKEHVAWAEKTRSLDRKLKFLQASWALAHLAPSDAVLKTESPLGPSGMPFPAWQKRLEDEISIITAAFDERNGNTSMSQKTQAYRAQFAP